MAGDPLPEDQGVDVIRALVGVNRLDIAEMPRDGVVVGDARRAEDLPEPAGIVARGLVELGLGGSVGVDPPVEDELAAAVGGPRAWAPPRRSPSPARFATPSPSTRRPTFTSIPPTTIRATSRAAAASTRSPASS